MRPAAYLAGPEIVFAVADVRLGATLNAARGKPGFPDGRRQQRLKTRVAELYNLDLDPSARMNRAAELPEKVAELMLRLKSDGGRNAPRDSYVVIVFR